jgi:hypothetical protein
MNDGRREDDAGWGGNERRAHLALTEDQIDAIAERAAAKVILNIQTQVGKNVLNKLLWLLGVVALGLAYWLSARGVIKLDP